MILGKYNAKRKESQAKKRLCLEGHESYINESMNEKDFPSAESEAEDDPKSEVQIKFIQD